MLLSRLTGHVPLNSRHNRAYNMHEYLGYYNSYGVASQVKTFYSYFFKFPQI